MSEIHRTVIRLNMRNPVHKKAWDYLTGMDKGIFKSYSHVAAVAIAEYFDRYYQVKGPDDEQLAKRIAEMLQVAVKPAEENEIPWDFLGS